MSETKVNREIITQENVALRGIGNPKNMGTCALAIGCYDKYGNFIEGSWLKLKPGHSKDWFRATPDTYYIKFACGSECDGEPILEYDTPIA